MTTQTPEPPLMNNLITQQDATLSDCVFCVRYEQVVLLAGVWYNILTRFSQLRKSDK